MSHHDEIETPTPGLIREVLVSGTIALDAPVFFDSGFTTVAGSEIVGRVVRLGEEAGRADIYCFDCARYAPDVLGGL